MEICLKPRGTERLLLVREELDVHCLGNEDREFPIPAWKEFNTDSIQTNYDMRPWGKKAK